MFTIVNIDQLLKADKEKKQAKTLELPVVKVVDTRSAILDTRKAEAVIVQKPSIQSSTENPASALLKELWAKDSRLRVDRAKLSSKIFRMMDDPNATQDDRKNLYAQIESFRLDLQSNYDLIQYIEKHGHLPPNKTEQPKRYSTDIIQLKERKQQL